MILKEFYINATTRARHCWSAVETRDAIIIVIESFVISAGDNSLDIL